MMIAYEKIDATISRCDNLSDEEKSLVVNLLQAHREGRLIELIVPISTTVWIPQQVCCCCDHSLDYISIVKRDYHPSLIDKPVFTSHQEAKEWVKKNYPGVRIE